MGLSILLFGSVFSPILSTNTLSSAIVSVSLPCVSITFTGLSSLLQFSTNCKCTSPSGTVRLSLLLSGSGLSSVTSNCSLSTTVLSFSSFVVSTVPTVLFSFCTLSSLGPFSRSFSTTTSSGTSSLLILVFFFLFFFSSLSLSFLLPLLLLPLPFS